jgi:hypothetical protein
MIDLSHTSNTYINQGFMISVLLKNKPGSWNQFAMKTRKTSINIIIGTLNKYNQKLNSNVTWKKLIKLELQDIF